MRTPNTIGVLVLLAAALAGCDQTPGSDTASPRSSVTAIPRDQDADDPGDPISPPRVRTTNPGSCIGEEFDVVTEPRRPEFAPVIDWYHDGCRVRVDVITERLPADLDCGVRTHHVIVTAATIGDRASAGEHVTFARTYAEFISAESESIADPASVLPVSVVFTGYESATTQLWADPDDNSSIHVVTNDFIEKWPQGVDNLCG